MPQVDWEPKPGWRKVLLPVLCAVIVITSSVVWTAPTVWKAVKPGVALASSQLPDTTSTKPMYMIVSQSASAVNIDAPDDYLKIYINPLTASPSVQIFNSQYDPCGAKYAGYDYTVPYTVAPCPNPVTDVNDEVDYDFYNTDNQENQTTQILSFNGNNGTNVNTGAAVTPAVHQGWTGSIPLPLTSPTSLKTGYRVIYAHVHFRAALPGGLTIKSHDYAFRTTNASDQLGFVNDTFPLGSEPPDGQLIVHTTIPSTDDYETNFHINFAPSCQLTSDQPAAIRWGDADDADSLPAGGTDGTDFAGDTNPSFWFYEIDQNGVTQKATQIYHWKNGLHSNPDIGGNNDYNELPFIAHPGWKYSWAWSNVNSAWNNFTAGANNIKMWIPFDSINYEIDCWDYHTQIAPVGHANGDTIDVTNPANQNLTFNLSASNILSQDGKQPASLDPEATLGLGGPPAGAVAVRQPGSWSTAIPPIRANSTVPGGQVTWQIDPTKLAVGITQVCFGDTISPHTSLEPGPFPNDPPTICYNLQNFAKRYPSAQGTSSDIHADAGACLGAPTAKGVEGSINSNSFGQYVVSTAGIISNFASNSGLGSASDLSLGANGGYSKICEVDYYDYATKHMPVGAAWTASPAGVQDANNLPGQVNIGGGKYVAYILGNIRIQGTMTHSTTLIASGTVSIDGNITDSGGANRSNAPSLAILSQGEVDIQCQCGIDPTVNAFIVSNDTIDTCYNGGVIPGPGICQNILHMNGFLLGKYLRLGRLGHAGGTGAQPGELISMNPVLYLNPPPFLDASVDGGGGLQGQGERSPLY